MPHGWSELFERKLLLSILDPDIKPKWDVVAYRLGEGFTGETCRQKFYKLKKECEQLQAPDGTVGPSTPKSKVNVAVKTPATGRGRKRNDTATEDSGSTTKRRKKAAGVAKEKPEEEPEEDDAQGDVKAKEEASVDDAAD